MIEALSFAALSAGLRARNPVETVALKDLTTFRIGGPATVVTLEDRQDLVELKARPHRWLGKGANLLVDDGPLPFVVVRLGEAFSRLELGPVRGGLATVRVGAGLDLAKLIAATTKAGLAGPEGLAGVPACVGGALRMNAGTATCWMLDWVSRVEVVLPGEDQTRWLERAALPAAYRHCGLPEGTLFLGAELSLSAEDPAKLAATATRLKQAKAATQPLAQPSAGCVFKNPRRDLPAGKLVDDLGLKGARVGGAEVSPVHANFIVNPEKQATARDVLQLVERIQHTAQRERGVDLRMEVERWV
jgi:UDP-N-acetylenolpyruvoylglucosamine reductase